MFLCVSSSLILEPVNPHSFARMYSLSAPAGLKTQRVRGGVSERRHGSTCVCTSPKVGSSIQASDPRRWKCSWEETSLEFHTGWETSPFFLHSSQTCSFVLSAAHFSSSG